MPRPTKTIHLVGPYLQLRVLRTHSFYAIKLFQITALNQRVLRNSNCSSEGHRHHPKANRPGGARSDPHRGPNEKSILQLSLLVIKPLISPTERKLKLCYGSFLGLLGRLVLLWCGQLGLLPPVLRFGIANVDVRC